MSVRTSSWTAAVLFVLLTLTGCADSPAAARQADSDAVQTVQAPATSQQVRQLVLPLDGYGLDQDLTLIQNARDKMISACMARQGLTWQLLRRVAAESWPNRRRYGLVEADVAQQFGYHPLPDPESDRRETQHAARDAALDARERAAAYGGDSRAGCVEQAGIDLLRGVPKANWALLDKVSADSYQRSQQAEPVVRAMRAWSACMRGVGFDYPEPMAANDDPRWATPSPSPTEVATARADVECKRRTSLVDLWWRTERDLQQRAIVTHAREFQIIHQARDRYLDNARAIDRT